LITCTPTPRRDYTHGSQEPVCTVLTYAAPSSNYRGESEENRTVIQKITKGDHEYAVISPESMRNALREILALREQPMNRRRLTTRTSSRWSSRSYPDADTYADDFLFGYMVAEPKEMKKLKRPAKRDSVLRMNMAVALHPYRFDATFHQSPLNARGARARGRTRPRRCCTARSRTRRFSTRSR
jgi:CRISPR-associated protein Cst2